MKYKKDSVNNAYQTIRNSLFCHSRPADQPTACPPQGSLNLLSIRKDVNSPLYYQPYPVFTFTNTHF